MAFNVGDISILRLACRARNYFDLTFRNLLANIDSKGDSDQVGVLELDSRTLITVVQKDSVSCPFQLLGNVGGGATHAWTQVYLPGSGWVEFDPTNGIIGNRDLIRVAVARDPAQAIPLHGTYTGPGGAYIGMEVNVEVTSVDQPETVNAEG